MQKLNYMTRYMRKRNARHRTLGLCSICRKVAMKDLRYCRVHLEYTRAYSKRLREERRKTVFNALGGHRCAVPGCNVCDPFMLNVDHRNNGGRKDNMSGQSSLFALRLWKLARENPKKLRRLYQALCSNHNLQKQQFRSRGMRWSLQIASTRLKQFLH